MAPADNREMSRLRPGRNALTGLYSTRQATFWEERRASGYRVERRSCCPPSLLRRIPYVPALFGTLYTKEPGTPALIKVKPCHLSTKRSAGWQRVHGAHFLNA
jgi:hypothetical protein